VQSIIPAFKRSLKKNRTAYQNFLRRFDRFFIPRVSRYVNQANDQAWAETDCLSCANCCKVMTPTFTKQDIARISAHLNMSPQAFKDKWLMKDPDSGDWVNHTQPCQFLDLKTNMCNIYEIRPHDCAAFPHFKRKPFADFNHIHEQNIDYCPATFRFVTHMKTMIEKDYEWS
jgi:Fe-S-cluster containining protein